MPGVNKINLVKLYREKTETSFNYLEKKEKNTLRLEIRNQFDEMKFERKLSSNSPEWF